MDTTDVTDKRGILDLDVYDAPELANRLGLHKVTVHEAIQKGYLRAKKFGGRAGYRILHHDVLEWLSELHQASLDHPDLVQPKETEGEVNGS